MSDLVQRQPISDAIVDKINTLILDNELKPGDRLPTEHKLAERFGVSRISVREATKALGFLGILNAKPGRGLTVGQVDMGRVTRYLGFQLAISDYPNHELIESRIVIETGVLPRVMSRMQEDAGLYDTLNELNSKLQKTRNLEKRIALDVQFHRTLLAASDLGPLVAFNDLLQVFFQHFLQSLKKGDWEVGVQSHQKIIDALRDKKLETACGELRKHIETHKWHR